MGCPRLHPWEGDVRRARHAPRASLTAPVPGCRRLVAEEGETAERGGRGALTHLFHLFTVTHTTSRRKGPLLPLGFCAH